MAATQVRGAQLLDNTVQRVDLDVTTVGQAVIRKVIPGTGISMSATGADAGTGDVTINATGGGGLEPISSGLPAPEAVFANENGDFVYVG
jgi:hypothetical protein